MSNLNIRRVQPVEMDRWFAMRIESLNDTPSAFMASPEKELAQGVDFLERELPKAAIEI